MENNDKPLNKTLDYYTKDARNIVWAMAFLWLLPVTMLPALDRLSPDVNVQWGIPMFGFLGALALLSSYAFYAGYLCWKRKNIGRILAFTCVPLFLFHFPIGTALSIAVIVKLNKRDYTQQLIRNGIDPLKSKSDASDLI